MIKNDSNNVKDFFYDNYNVSEFNVKAGWYLEYAMKINSKLKAKYYLKYLITMLRKELPNTQDSSDESLEKLLKQRIAYYAGCCDDVVRWKVEYFYEAAHPIFGKISEHGSPEPEEVEECDLKQCDLVTLRTDKAETVLEKCKLELEALRKSNATILEMYGSELSAQSLIEEERKLESIINKYQRYKK